MMNAPSPTVGITTYPADDEKSASIDACFFLNISMVSLIPSTRSGGAADLASLSLPPHAGAAKARSSAAQIRPTDETLEPFFMRVLFEELQRRVKRDSFQSPAGDRSRAPGH